MHPLLRGLFVTILSMALADGARADDVRVLADFPSALEDLPWRVVDDGVMGGRSKGRLERGEDVLVFRGATNTDGGGFSQIRSDPRGFALGEFDGIRLRIRGDGRRWTFRLTTSDTRDRRRRPSWWADFPTRAEAWTSVDVPFERFVPRWRGQQLSGLELDPGRIDGLGVMIYDGEDGPFRLEIDWIGAYREARPFELADLRWKRRPLVLFAPTADHPELRRQLEAVEASREAFEDRDMALVVVLVSGTSSVDGRPLAPEDARRIRETHGVGEEDFALRLVGKDGDVKRRSDEAVPMQAIYDQIDAMPMRRAEMEERD